MQNPLKPKAVREQNLILNFKEVVYQGPWGDQYQMKLIRQNIFVEN